MKKNSLAAVLSATCVVTALAGCGASGSSNFLAGATGACADFYTKAYELPPPLGLAQLIAYPGKQQALLEGELRALRALKAPAAQQRLYTAYIADLVKLDETYFVIISDAKTTQPPAGHLSAAKRLGRRLSSSQTQVERQARDLGLAECAKDPYTATHNATNQ